MLCAAAFIKLARNRASCRVTALGAGSVGDKVDSLRNHFRALFVTTASDLLRRQDVSGFGKALWVISFIALPYIGIFAYILTQGSGTTERNRMQAQHYGTSYARSWASVLRMSSRNLSA